MDQFILVAVDDLRELLVLGIISICLENFYHALSSAYALRLCLAAELERMEFCVVALGEVHKRFHVVAYEVDVLCVCIVLGHLGDDPHEAKQTVSV